MDTKILIKDISAAYSIPSLQGKRVSILIDENGLVERIGNIKADATWRTIDATGLILSPGWVDIHTHIYDGVCDIGLDPDRIGPKTGVTALVDAGSAGHVNYHGFEKYIINGHDYGIFAFLNYGSIGISRCNVICDYETDDFIQPEETIACINAHKDHIRGVKVRACKVVLKNRGIEIVKGAKAVAREVGLPLMVHVGEPGPTLPEILDVLGARDIVTHCFHGKPGNILDPRTGKVIDAAIEAKARGVLFDIGHGAASFNVSVGKTCMAQGFLPDLIGSDLHTVSIAQNAVSLPVTMSKIQACGLPSQHVVDCVTTRARQILDIEGFQGDSLLGTRADFTLFQEAHTAKTFYDANDNRIDTSLQYVPHYTVYGPHIVQCAYGEERSE